MRKKTTKYVPLTVPLTLPVSGWAHTQAVREVDCPHCNAKAGQNCVQPKGRLALQPHWQRGKAYRDKIGPAELEKRHAVEHAIKLRSECWHLLDRLKSA